MKIKDMSITSYLDLLASNAPAPGGGSASALSGAQGTALFTMVAALTVGKEKYKNDWELCERVIKDGTELKNKLEAQIDADTEAFNLISAAFKMPKDTDEQKAVRKQAIYEGTLKATEVPFHTMELALHGLELTQSLYEHSNPNAVSDLGVAALDLLTCARGAYLNVMINIGGLPAEQSDDFRNKSSELSKRCADISNDLFIKIANIF